MGIIGWILTLLVLGGLGYGAYWYYNQFMSGEKPSGGMFRGGREKRLAVLDQASVDGRRKLVLIRRDNVEHLIMTGGPVDVVVETGIVPATASNPASSPDLRSEATQHSKADRSDKADVGEIDLEPRVSLEPTFGKTTRRIAQTVDK